MLSVYLQLKKIEHIKKYIRIEVKKAAIKRGTTKLEQLKSSSSICLTWLQDAEEGGN